MDPKLKYILLKTVQDDGILPITSVCNMACQFCSHRNNPPGLDVYRLGHLGLDLIKELLQYLAPEEPVISGESATRVIGGDPMTHPDFIQIIELLRKTFPRKEIRLTTNGSYLNGEMLNFLAAMKPLELNISLNCSSPAERVFLMADSRPEEVFSGLKLLAKTDLSFHGSIVAMPHLLGWESLGRSIELLSYYGARTIRVFLPGFTRYSSPRLQFPVREIYGQIRSFLEKYEDLGTPILLEPPEINDLQARVKGIIPGSPAAASPLEKGALITAVNGDKPRTRVEAFQLILAAANPHLQYQQGGRKGEIILEKKAGEASGLIFDYDLDPAVLDQVTRLLLNNTGKNLALLTSVAAAGIMGAFLEDFNASYGPGLPAKEIDLLVVENRFFGGSIIAAGLLTISDIISKVKESARAYDILVLPGIIFDIFGNDLTGRNYREIEEALGVSLEII